MHMKCAKQVDLEIEDWQLPRAGTMDNLEDDKTYRDSFRGVKNILELTVISVVAQFCMY